MQTIIITNNRLCPTLNARSHPGQVSSIASVHTIRSKSRNSNNPKPIQEGVCLHPLDDLLTTTLPFTTLIRWTRASTRKPEPSKEAKFRCRNRMEVPKRVNCSRVPTGRIRRLWQIKVPFLDKKTKKLNSTKILDHSMGVPRPQSPDLSSWVKSSKISKNHSSGELSLKMPNKF